MVFQGQRSNTTKATPSTSSSRASTTVAPRCLERDLDQNRSSDSLPPSDTGVHDVLFLSVDSCDCSRRSFEKETSELLATNANTRDEIAKENRVSQQLNTDMLHSDTEMKSTNRKATELLESSGLQDHLLQPMAGTLLIEIMVPLSSSSTSTSEDGSKQTTGGTNANAVPDKLVTFPSFLDEHKEAMKKWTQVIKDRKESLKRVCTELCEREQSLQRHLQNTRGMEEELAKAHKSAEESEPGLEAEKRRNSKYVALLESTRAAVAKWTEHDEKLTDELARKKVADVSAIKNMKQQEQAATKEHDDMVNTVATQEAAQAELNQEFEELTRLLADCKLLHQMNDEQSTERQQCFQETSDTQKKAEEAFVQLAATTAKHVEAEEKLCGLVNDDAAFVGEKPEKDKLYAIKHLSDHTEIAELSKESEQIVSRIDEMHEEIAAHKKKLDEAVANIKDSQEATEENLKTVQAEIESMRQTHREVKQNHEESNAVAVSETLEMELQAKQTEEANESEQKRIHESKAEQSESRQVRMLEANDAMDREQSELIQVRDVVSFTKEHLKKTSREKEKILSVEA